MTKHMIVIKIDASIEVLELIAGKLNFKPSECLLNQILEDFKNNENYQKILKDNGFKDAVLSISVEDINK